MNNSFNFSHFSDLLETEFSADIELHRSESIMREDVLSLEDGNVDSSLALTDSDRG